MVLRRQLVPLNRQHLFSPGETVRIHSHHLNTRWIRSGRLEAALKLSARLLYEQGKLNLEEPLVDATFASAKKGLRGRSHASQQEHEDRRCLRWQ